MSSRADGIIIKRENMYQCSCIRQTRPRAYEKVRTPMAEGIVD